MSIAASCFEVNKLAVIHHFTCINLMMIDLVLICVLESVRVVGLGSIQSVVQTDINELFASTKGGCSTQHLTYDTDVLL